MEDAYGSYGKRCSNLRIYMYIFIIIVILIACPCVGVHASDMCTFDLAFGYLNAKFCYTPRSNYRIIVHGSYGQPFLTMCLHKCSQSTPNEQAPAHTTQLQACQIHQKHNIICNLCANHYER